MIVKVKITKSSGSFARMLHNKSKDQTPREVLQDVLRYLKTATKQNDDKNLKDKLKRATVFLDDYIDYLDKTDTFDWEKLIEVHKVFYTLKGAIPNWKPSQSYKEIALKQSKLGEQIKEGNLSLLDMYVIEDFLRDIIIGLEAENEFGELHDIYMEVLKAVLVFKEQYLVPGKVQEVDARFNEVGKSGTKLINLAEKEEKSE